MSPEEITRVAAQARIWKDEGWAARWLEHPTPLTDCPYPADSLAAFWWEMGWNDAHDAVEYSTLSEEEYRRRRPVRCVG